MVFQKSNRFPKSIYENIAYTFRIAGIRDGRMIDETVEDSLRRAALPVGDLRLRYGIKMGLAGLLALFCTQVLRLPHDNWAILTVLCFRLERKLPRGLSSSHWI
jgi:hypothetical protein